MIPIDTRDGIVYKKSNSPQYIVVSEYKYTYLNEKLETNGCYYEEAIYLYDQDAFRQYTQEVFNYIADRAERELNGDYGVEDEFTYAYIMAHTEPRNHKYLRFYNWDGKPHGWVSLTNWKKDLKLPKQATELEYEYYRIPTCVDSISAGTRHIFPVVYKVDQNKQKTIMFHDNLSDDERCKLPSENQHLHIQQIISEPNRSYFLGNSKSASGCAYATAEFFKLSNEEIENFDKTLEELQEKLNRIQENAQDRIKTKPQENNGKNPEPNNTTNKTQQRINKSYNIPHGTYLNTQQTTINTPNTHNQSSAITINTDITITNRIAYRQQQAEKSFIERIKSTRENREKMFKKYSTTHYNEQSIYRGNKGRIESWAELVKKNEQSGRQRE